MTVYKYFIKVSMKHKSIILGYLAIFLLLSIISGSSTGDQDKKFLDTGLDIGIIDRSKTELSQGLVDYLSGKNNIIDTVDNIEYIKEQISIQMVDGVVIIAEDFEERVINKEKAIELYKSDIEIGGFYLDRQVEKYLIFANSTYEKGSFDIGRVKKALGQEVDVELVGANTKGQNRAANEWFMVYFNFTSYIIIAIYVAVIGLVMTEFRRKNIEDRMKISSKKLLNFNIEIYLGQVSLGLFISLVFILGSVLLKGGHIGEVDFLKYVFNLIVFSFSILCFTFLVNNLTSNRFVINGISTVFSLGASFISGVMVPQDHLGEGVLSVARFFPSYYFIKINESTANSILDLKYEIFMQLIFGLVFLLMGLYISRVNQRD